MIWSDNGNKFIGAKKELPESIENCDVINIAVDLANKGVMWRFNPTRALHQRGNWEVVFKRVL